MVDTSLQAGAKVGSAVGIGLLSSASIFTDPAYMWMAIVGAIVGLLSTLHTVYSRPDTEMGPSQITVEAIKGFVLGVASIPLSFMAISQGIVSKLLGIDLGEVSLSLSLVAAFIFSWYAVPVLDGIAKKVIGKDGKE